MWIKYSGLLAIGVSLFFLTGCFTWWLENYPSDNLLEETAEELIEREMGWDLDLSPFSPEKP